jgi:hypothetical protein
MLSLNANKDNWQLIFDSDFVPEEIKNKYTKVLSLKKSFITDPVSFVNESVQKIQVLGFSGASFQQQQTTVGYPLRDQTRTAENYFQHPTSDVNYRSVANPIQIIDKTLNVQFRMDQGFLNYFIIFESFFYKYCRDTTYEELDQFFVINIYNELNEVYCRIKLYHPIIDSMDMLDLDFSNVKPTQDTFQVVFKYTNIEFEFIENNTITG